MSFPKKIELLLGMLRPKSVQGIIDFFDFDMKEFKKIDKLRHEVTHNPKFSEPIQNIESKLDYMYKTFLLLEKLANQKYSGQIPPNQI